MDPLTYVLAVVLWLALAWVAACIYLTIRYDDDGRKYVVYRFDIEDDGTYTAVEAVGRVRFPTAYLILNAMPEIRTASSCDKNDKRSVVVVRTSDKTALAVDFAGPLKSALSRKKRHTSHQ